MRRLWLLSPAFFFLLSPHADSRGLGSGNIGVGYGPGFGTWGGWSGPYGYPGYGQPNTGQIKLDTDVKDAEVYIDGAFAGTVRSLKTIRLRQGEYLLDVRAVGRTSYSEKVYVVTGKTLRLRPELRVEPKK